MLRLSKMHAHTSDLPPKMGIEGAVMIAQTQHTTVVC
jgi:hypothetical protein